MVGRFLLFIDLDIYKLLDMKIIDSSCQKETKEVRSAASVQSLRTDRITALYLGCKTNDLPDFPRPIWLPIYRMSWDDEGYFYYSYTKGFEQHHEQLKGHIINPIGGFSQLWKTKHLDTRFGTRIPRRHDSMSEYDWLGIGDAKGDYIACLARSGGRRFGDNYDIFPEVQPDFHGDYNFYFAVLGLIDSIKQSDDAKTVFETLETGASLELKVGEEHSYIIGRGLELGHCPEYINRLLKLVSLQQQEIQVEQVNRQSNGYGRGIIVNLKLKFSSSPWLTEDFQPLNSMPV